MRFLSVFVVAFGSLTAQAFFNPMKTMGNMMGGVAGSMSPTSAMVQMCANPMGKMATGMMNNMGNMASSMPMVGGMMNGMKQGMTSQMMEQVLNDPQQTIKALDCAKRSQQMVSMMLDTLHARPYLLYSMGGAMYLDSRIAKSMMDLALVNPKVGRFLLSQMNPILFKQMTHALLQHKGMTDDMTLLVSKHMHYALRYDSQFMKVLTDWGSSGNDSDGVEMGVERFLYALFSDAKAANLFMEVIEEIDEEDKINILNILFLGKVKNYYYYTEKKTWGDATFNDQAYYNLYAMVKGLKISLIRGENTEDASVEKADQEAEKLMNNMMRYMIDHKTKRPTPWGMKLMQVLVDGSQVHQDKDVSEFAQFLTDLMPPKFQKGLKHIRPDKYSKAPREFIKADLPYIPQMRSAGSGITYRNRM